MLFSFMFSFFIIEMKAFKEFMNVFDRHFAVSTPNTAKNVGLDNINRGVQAKIQVLLGIIQDLFSVDFESWLWPFYKNLIVKIRSHDYIFCRHNRLQLCN